MNVLFKYILWLLSLFSLVIYYFLGTTLGHVSIGYMVANYYSKKMDNKLEILSLNIENYPFIIAEIKINGTADLSLKGNSDSDNMDMSYHLRGESFKWSGQHVLHPINLKGTLNGKLSELLIKGEGEVFYGETNYSFIKKSTSVEELEVLLNDISSNHLVKFLKYDLELKGDMDVILNFEHFSSFRKKGKATISMKKATMPKVSGEVEFSLDGTIGYRDLLRDFFVDIDSDIGKLRVANGYYNKSAGLMKAEYGLRINDLSDFEKFLGHEYKGTFDTAGNVKYETEKLSLIGDTNTYGGLLKYNYKNNYLEIEFNAVSLEKLLRQISFPALLSSKVYGTASYDIEEDIVLVNTKLKETRFRRTKMTDKVYELTDIDILKDVYDNSLLTGGYQNSILTSFLQIDNGINHLYLRNTQMNSKTNKITADFEVAIDGQEFVGEIYGTLEDPKVNLDISKLIRYQINKKIENFFGTEKPLDKKNTKAKLKVDEIELGDIKQKTRSFLDGFFD